MAKGIGRLVQMGIARETTRGTAVAPTFWIPYQEFALEEKDTRIKDEQSRGVIEDSVSESIVKQWAEGSIKAPIGDRSFALFLYSLLGTLSTAANTPETGVHTHTITVLQNAQHPTLTFGLDDPLAAQDYQHVNGVLLTLEIAYEMGNFVNYTIGLKARKGATATLTPAILTENRYLPQHLTFKQATNLAGLAAAVATVIKSLTLKITQNIEDDDVLGNIAPADFLGKNFMIEGTVEAIWQNESDFKTNALAGTVRALRIDLVNTGATIGAVTNPQLQIDLAKVNFKELTRPIRINELVKQTLSFTAHYSTGDTQAISIKAVNTTASY